MNAILVALLLCLSPAQAEILATNLAVSGDSQTTRITLDLNEDIGFSAKVVPDPFRVVIEMDDVEFETKLRIKATGLVRGLRYGRPEGEKARVVIETVGPVLIGNSFLSPKTAESPAQIIIDLMTIEEDVFRAAFLKESGKLPLKLSPVVETPNAVEAPRPIRKPVLKPEKPKPTLQKIAKPARADGKKLVVVDPGHGGIDPGALAKNKVMEKDVVLTFALALKQALLADGRTAVSLTRETDVFLSLKDRVAVARREQADLFIAIHADTVRGGTVTGTTLYTLSEEASDAEAQALADKENRADHVAGIDFGQENQDVADILLELLQRESKNYAISFSRSALPELKAVSPMAGKPLRSAGFTVLKAPDVPSVLIELGFLSNPKDVARLTNADWQKRMAEALTRAITRHFDGQLAQAN